MGVKQGTVKGRSICQKNLFIFNSFFEILKTDVRQLQIKSNETGEAHLRFNITSSFSKTDKQFEN